MSQFQGSKPGLFSAVILTAALSACKPNVPTPSESGGLDSLSTPSAPKEETDPIKIQIAEKALAILGSEASSQWEPFGGKRQGSKGFDLDDTGITQRIGMRYSGEDGQVDISAFRVTTISDPPVEHNLALISDINNSSNVSIQGGLAARLYSALEHKSGEFKKEAEAKLADLEAKLELPDLGGLQFSDMGRVGSPQLRFIYRSEPEQAVIDVRSSKGAGEVLGVRFGDYEVQLTARVGSVECKDTIKGEEATQIFKKLETKLSQENEAKEAKRAEERASREVRIRELREKK